MTNITNHGFENINLKDEEKEVLPTAPKLAKLLTAGSIKARKWVFDIFFEDKITIDWEKLYNEYSDIIRYLIVQKEEGEKNQGKHWQGYIQLYNQKRRRGLWNLTTGLKIKHWCEPARGTAEQNAEYCSKLRTSLNESYEFGKPTKQGARTDVEHIKKIMDDGCSMLDVANENFPLFLRYHRGFAKYKEMIELKNRQKRRKVKTMVISGPTRCGKTSKVLDKYGDENVYIVENDDNGHIWFDGYNGEDVILFDDYNNNMKCTRLLRLLDKYKVRLPIKGGHTYANWTKIYFTTNLTKEEFHAQAKPAHREALFKRITTFLEMSRSTVSGNNGAETNTSCPKKSSKE